MFVIAGKVLCNVIIVYYAMSASDAQSFVQTLSVEPRLQQAVEDNDIVAAATENDYTVSSDELESAIKTFVESDLPDHDIDGKVEKRADSSSTCNTTACGGKSCH
jgi:hypothetical protein